MTEREFLQQLFLLRQDIESCPMLDKHAAAMRERWVARLGSLLLQRNAAIPSETVNGELLAALKEMTEDLEARWDMRDRSTNFGIVHCVERARNAIARAENMPVLGVDWGDKREKS